LASEASLCNRLTAACHEYDTQQFEGGFARQKHVALVLVYDFLARKSSIFAFIFRITMNITVCAVPVTIKPEFR
jgi:hypothetical protein